MTGSELKARRKSLGLTQVQLAALAGCHPSYVQQLERSEIPATIIAALDRAEQERAA